MYCNFLTLGDNEDENSKRILGGVWGPILRIKVWQRPSCRLGGLTRPLWHKNGTVLSVLRGRVGETPGDDYCQRRRPDS